VTGQLLAGGELISLRALRRLAGPRAGDLARRRPLTFAPRLVVPDVALLLAAAARHAPVALLPAGLPAIEERALRGAVPREVGLEVAAVLFTSGSSGRRKAVPLDRAAFVASAAASAAVLGWHDDDRWLACLPLAHIGGLSVLARCLWAGRTAVLVDRGDRFDAAAVAAQIARDRVTLVSLVPTMLARLLALAPAWHPPAHLRAVVLGGAPPSPALLERTTARGVPVRTTYGMTETCSHVAIDGALLPGVDAAIDEDGRIMLRGPMIGAGGFTTRGGWFTTADRGTLVGGRLEITGRADAAILSGGANVDPAAVEAALESVPGIAAACVFGVPDDDLGERVCAAIVASAAPPALADLDRALRARLAPHERPRRVALLAELPLGPSGKVDRRETARRSAGRLVTL
jgi:O-succinylbenzoic acid--CoA ligase